MTFKTYVVHFRVNTLCQPVYIYKVSDKKIVQLLLLRQLILDYLSEFTLNQNHFQLSRAPVFFFKIVQYLQRVLKSFRSKLDT